MERDDRAHAGSSSTARLTRRCAAGVLSMLTVGVAAHPRHLLARQPTAAPTLLVRGEADLAANAPLGWRVVRDVAEAPPKAVFEQRALGFAVASGPFASLLLTDEATGSAYRLAPGEAAFVREGTWQRRESLDAQAQAYLRIGLVAAETADDAGGDRLLFAGPAFAPPGRTVTLALRRIAPVPGEVVGLPPSAGETLVLVEQGEATLDVGEAAPRELLRTTVGSDTSYAIRSVAPAATLYGARLGTSILLATIE